MHRRMSPVLAAGLLLLTPLLAAACKSGKTWTLQGTVDDLFGDLESFLGTASLPGKHLAVIRNVHEKKSWVFREGLQEPLETTRRAVRGLATCNYASWQEAALVVEILSSMADDHSSALVRAEALDTLTRIGPWTLAAASPPEHPSTEAELIEGLKVLKQAMDRPQADPAFTFHVASAVTTLANHPFERVDEAPAEQDLSNRSAASLVDQRLGMARGALRAINGRGLEGFHGDPGVREALDRAYVALSASVLRLTIEKAALGDTADTTRRAAVHDLGVLRPEGGARALRRVLVHDEDSSVRREAAKSLGSYPLAEAVPGLLDGLADEMVEVRGAAARSLESLTGERFGDDRAAWLRWWQARSAQGAPAAPPGVTGVR